MAKDRTPPQLGNGASASPPDASVVARRRLGPRVERVEARSADDSSDDGYDVDIDDDSRVPFMAVVGELRGRGWPLEVERCWLGGEWVCYPGPARVGIGRNLPVDDAVEDDSLVVDVAVQETGPMQVHLSGPQTPRGNGPGEFDLIVAADLGADVVVDTLGASLRSARWAGLALLRDDAACCICGDAYPAAHLLSPAENAPGLCPACVFDGDVFDLDVAYLAYQLDRLLVDDLAAPAGWAGVATLLTALGADNLASQLVVEWKDTGLVYLPMPFWDDAGDSWVWVNATKGPLAALRPGTSTGRLAATIARLYPERRRQVEREFQACTGTRLGWELWTAAVAYVVSFDTQARDRPRHRGPWHVLGSFESLPEAWAVDDGYVVQAAVDGVRRAFSELLGLAWDDQLGTDMDPKRRGLAAAVAFADLCEANGWEHVRVDDDDDPPGIVSVEAMNQVGSYRLLARWSEDDDGRAHFAGAGLATNDRAEPMNVKTLREAKRFVELYGHGTDPAGHPYVPERDGSMLEWEARRAATTGPVPASSPGYVPAP